MKIAYILLALLCLPITLASTGNISEIVEPYKISFSLPDDVQVIVNTTIENKETFYGEKYTLYSLILYDPLNPDHVASIGVAQYEAEVMDLVLFSNRNIEGLKGLGYITMDNINKEIDGRPGFLVIGSPTLTLPEIHVFGYNFDNKTRVATISTLLWDDGSSLMLKTLHVEKVAE